MEGLINFPSKFVFIHKVKNHLSLKLALLPYMESVLDANRKEYLNDHKVWDCKVYTSFFDPEGSNKMLKDLPEVQKSIWEALDEMLKVIHITEKPKESYISGFWWNYYQKGHSQEVHQHCGSDFSGIYILKSSGENKTVFYSAENHRMLNKTLATKEVGEGNIILFPSHLPHYVNPIEDEDGRITIAFNITCEL